MFGLLTKPREKEMRILFYSVMSTLVLFSAGCTNVDRSRTLGDPTVSGKTIAQQVCSSCHGVDGNSISPEFPKLAGQQPQYLITQLKNFNDHVRTDRLAQEIMASMSRNLTDEQISQIADYFYQQKPKNLTKLVGSDGAGKRIFESGIPDKGVVPCMTCHGTKAEGNSVFPRLAGQHPQYLAKQLLVFRDTHGRPDTPMGDISKPINDREIEQLADYIAGLN